MEFSFSKDDDLKKIRKDFERSIEKEMGRRSDGSVDLNRALARGYLAEICCPDCTGTGDSSVNLAENIDSGGPLPCRSCDHGMVFGVRWAYREKYNNLHDLNGVL